MVIHLDDITPHFKHCACATEQYDSSYFPINAARYGHTFGWHDTTL